MRSNKVWQIVERVARLLRAGLGPGKHFLFLFSEPVKFPPDVHDMKAYYITKEVLRRGIRVTWLTLGDKFRVETESGIIFSMIPRMLRRFSRTSFWLRIFFVVAISKATRVNYVCVDDWLFYRGHAEKFLPYEIALKKAGVKFVFDQRDPFIDFEISGGRLEPNSSLHKMLLNRYRMIYRHADLLTITSHSYERAMTEEEGLEPRQVFGTFRGIDPDLFNAGVEPLDFSKEIGVDKKFIIGWFGIMHPHRQIREVLLPLIKRTVESIQDAYFIIGGDGPEKSAFTDLQEEYGERFSMPGFVQYSKLPGYLAGCDVLLCPVDTRYRFSRNSIWLKILEALAVGRPIISTRTNVSNDDLSRLRGVIWVDGSLESYFEALLKVRSEYQTYRAQALEQAKNFDDYSTSHTIAKIVDRILKIE